MNIKRFIVIPGDALNIMTVRFTSQDEAVQAASDMCAETGMAHTVVEMKATASRADRPVTVKSASTISLARAALVPAEANNGKLPVSGQVIRV